MTPLRLCATTLTADITLQAITKPTLFAQVNPSEVVNLTNFHYTGTNADLKALVGGMNPTALVNFILAGHTLADLKTGGSTLNTAFSGALLATPIVPEPGTMVLALAAAPALGGFWFSRRRRQKADMK